MRDLLGTGGLGLQAAQAHPTGVARDRLGHAAAGLGADRRRRCSRGRRTAPRAPPACTGPSWAVVRQTRFGGAAPLRTNPRKLGLRRRHRRVQLHQERADLLAGIAGRRTRRRHRRRRPSSRRPPEQAAANSVKARGNRGHQRGKFRASSTGGMAWNVDFTRLCLSTSWSPRPPHSPPNPARKEVPHVVASSRWWPWLGPSSFFLRPAAPRRRIPAAAAAAGAAAGPRWPRRQRHGRIVQHGRLHRRLVEHRRNPPVARPPRVGSDRRHDRRLVGHRR